MLAWHQVAINSQDTMKVYENHEDVFQIYILGYKICAIFFSQNEIITILRDKRVKI